MAPPTTSREFEVEADSRNRVPLGRLIGAGQRRFRATKTESGDIVLTPMALVSERELAMLRNPEALASLEKGIGQATRGEGTRYPADHFAKLAEELGEDDDED